MANLFEPGLYMTIQEQNENFLVQKKLQVQPQLPFLTIQTGHLVHVIFTFSDGNSLCEIAKTKKVGLIESKKLYKLLDNQVVFMDSIYNENMKFIEFNQIFKPVFILIVDDSLFCYHEDESLNFNFRIQDSKINDCLDELVNAPLFKQKPRIDSGIELGGNNQEYLDLLKELGGDINDAEYNNICKKIQGHISFDSLHVSCNRKLDDHIQNNHNDPCESDALASRASSSNYFFAAGHKDILTPNENKRLEESTIEAQKEILASLGGLRSKLIAEKNTLPISTSVPNQEKGPLDAMQAFVQYQQLTAENLRKHQKITAQKIREVDEKIARGIHSFMAVTKAGYDRIENILSSVQKSEKTVDSEKSNSKAETFPVGTRPSAMSDKRIDTEPIMRAQMEIPTFYNVFESSEIESMLCKQRLLYDDERISGHAQIDDSDSDFDEDDDFKVCGWLAIESICLQFLLHTLFG